MNITPEYLAKHRLTETIVDRFWDKVFILTYDRGCWLWIGGTDHNGYGAIYRGSQPGPMMIAHRVSWILFRGPLNPKEPLRHSCDNPLCVRPDHLSKGTQLDNVHDMIERGRMPRGEHRAWAKISSTQVAEIRSLYDTGYFSQQELGDRFAIAQQTVSQIVRKKKWKHVTQPMGGPPSYKQNQLR